jgi:hypothetical protein
MTCKYAVFFILLFLSACNKIPQSVDTKLTDKITNLPPNWIPVIWHDKSSVVFFDETKVFEVNINTLKVVKVFAKVPGTKSINCLDQDTLDLFITELYESKEGDLITKSFTRNKILNLKTSQLSTFDVDKKWVDSTSFNCELVDNVYKEPSPAPISDWYQWSRNFIKKSDGELYLFGKSDQLKLKATFLKRDAKFPQEFLLPTYRDYYYRARGFESSFDRSGKNYLLYFPENDFSLSSNHWPMKAYIFSPVTKDLSTIEIPAGPWVQEYGFLDELKGFSCGVTCYTHSKLALLNGRIFIAIYGKLARPESSGLYELVNGRWTRFFIFKPNSFEDLISGPDSCTLLVKLNEGSKVLNVCP